MYIQLDDNKWIKVIDGKPSILIPIDLQEELQTINDRLAELPPDPTDAELLAWAKLHYPGLDYSAERNTLNNRKAELEIDLSNMGY